jgi:hypothetical protein
MILDSRFVDPEICRLKLGYSDNLKEGKIGDKNN